MTMLFAPPSERRPMGDPFNGSPAHLLFSRVFYDVGITVVKFPDGTYRQFHENDSESWPDGSIAYTGGRVHEVSDAEGLLLIGAGYGEYVTPEGE